MGLCAEPERGFVTRLSNIVTGLESLPGPTIDRATPETGMSHEAGCAYLFFSLQGPGIFAPPLLHRHPICRSPVNAHCIPHKREFISRKCTCLHTTRLGCVVHNYASVTALAELAFKGKPLAVSHSNKTEVST